MQSYYILSRSRALYVLRCFRGAKTDLVSVLVAPREQKSHNSN